MNSSRPSLALLWLIVLAGAPQLNALSSLNSKSKKNVASTRITTLPILSLTTAATTATTRQVSRTQFLDGMIMSSIYLIGSPLAAHATADIIDQLASKTALRNVKSAQRKLLAMKDLYIVTNDYTTLRESLRVEPFSTIRKSCVTIIRAVDNTGSEDEEENKNNQARKKELEMLYKQFITSLEKLDSAAGVASRGRTLVDGDWNAAYQATVDALDSFINLAQPPLERPTESFVE